MTNILLLILNIISFAATVLFAIFGIYEQIMGPADAEKLLKKLHIPLSYNQALIIGFVCLALMIVSYILRAKLSGKLQNHLKIRVWDISTSAVHEAADRTPQGRTLPVRPCTLHPCSTQNDSQNRRKRRRQPDQNDHRHRRHAELYL